ncbi:unnamed protein product [Acanthoscelides obtectus]|uniref:Uncharacterized protein n=1 Tax=Acanthoscelides obtectus TaxID=200917 RepID=A0A9P0LGI8_ACAOB|nr:unnamed protein product [Acanthoscelides obtectus]CAK1655726.1 hypothetical protein AOBTE_LOCUS19283 [Acanthoscelides obtectus]
MAENSTTNYKKTVGINSLYKNPEAYNQAVLLMKVGKLQNKSLDIHIIYLLHYFQLQICTICVCEDRNYHLSLLFQDA